MKRHFIFMVIALLFCLTGCSAIDISENDIPIGNSIGLFKYKTDYNSSESSDEILTNNKVDFNGVELEISSDFKVDSQSSDVVLFKNDGISVSLSVLPNEADKDIYREAFSSKLTELYPDFKFSFNGDLMLLGEGDLTWDSYQGYITDSEKEYEVMGYYTLSNNKLVCLEFGVSLDKSVEDYEEVQNSIIQSTNIK